MGEIQCHYFEGGNVKILSLLFIITSSVNSFAFSTISLNREGYVQEHILSFHNKIDTMAMVSSGSFHGLLP